MRKVTLLLLLLGLLPMIVGCPAAPVAVGVGAAAGAATIKQVTALIVAGTVVLAFVEKAYDVDRARLLRDKAQLELDLVKEGKRTTEVILLTPEQADAILKMGYFTIEAPDGSKRNVSVEVE
jgi:hypothetical protein